MTLYVCVGRHAITPEGTGTVCPGDRVDLDPKTAEPYVATGDLALAPAPPSPVVALEPPSKSKETQP